MKGDLIVVSGAGGFIGGHLVAEFLHKGFRVRGADIKPLNEWYQVHHKAENFAGPLNGDCRDFRTCRTLCKDALEVYQLAADMGGMGFIENNKALCMLSVLTNTHMILAAQEAGVNRFFYASSACVYNADKQKDPNVTALKEADAYPALPEDGYGWEKLFSERMCRHFREDFGLNARIARFHNVYGPHGTWEGGREKAP
ncbi:MAG: NAD-dependent epimerase/dehydratase family protein, partial [Gammaproteobacteria bacterium]